MNSICLFGFVFVVGSSVLRIVRGECCVLLMMRMLKEMLMLVDLVWVKKIRWLLFFSLIV